MITLEQTDVTSGRTSPVAARLEGVVVDFLLDRLTEIPPEAVRDIALLAEQWADPQTGAETKAEIRQTLHEILFPGRLGAVHLGRAGAVEQMPETLQQRAARIGGAIKAKRTEKKLKQTDLAAKSGLPQSHLSRLEAGLHSPSAKTLERIAQALDVPPKDLDPAQP